LPDPRALLADLLAGYYKTAKEITPKHVEQREFGFGTLETKIAVRHIAFDSESKYRAYLLRNAPAYISCSEAYYKYPAARPMEKKIPTGGELAFDLDATEMNLACQKVHGTKWVCGNCLNEVKQEVFKLIEDFLVPDFGFSETEIGINFSGNRGYHLHIDADRVLKLTNPARRAISDYIAGNGLDFNEFFPTAGQRGTKLLGPKPNDPAWGGKIARNFLNYLNSGAEKLMMLGMNRQTAAELYKKRALVELGIRSGNWDMVYVKKKGEVWANVIKNQAIMQSDRIDKNVTSDISHLLRVPNTIHCETGLMATRIASKSELERFNPLKDSIAFRKGELELHVDKSPELTMNSSTYGPYDNKDVSLPMYVGLYLYLKGCATIKNYTR
jgi:DNA primase small subunit